MGSSDLPGRGGRLRDCREGDEELSTGPSKIIQNKDREFKQEIPLKMIYSRLRAVGLCFLYLALVPSLSPQSVALQVRLSPSQLLTAS